MKPTEFVTQFLPHAQQTQAETGISAVAILAQAALESGWGERIPGNMFFGVKDSDGLNGNEQLLLTTEYSRKPDSTFGGRKIESVTPVTINGKQFYKYKIWDWFRKFDTPKDCFNHHAEFFLKNKRYAGAVAVGADPLQFLEAIAKAGYATAPDYFQILKKVAAMILKLLPSPAAAAKKPDDALESFSPDDAPPPTIEADLLAFYLKKVK